MSVMTRPHEIMMIGSQRLGRSFLSSRLLGTSKAAYVKKKAVKHQLYSSLVNPRSSWRPSIFALPMFPPDLEVNNVCGS